MYKKGLKIKRSKEDVFVDCFSYGILSIFILSIILPVMQVITISLSPARVVNQTGFHLIPKAFDFSGYTTVLTNNEFWHSYGITIMRTIIGTASAILVTVLTAYPLSKKGLPYKKGIMFFIIITMYFNGGMIPKYIVLRNIGLTNKFAVYILPMLVTGFALIITRSFFEGIPESLEESAKIDGASDMKVLFSIYFPLSKPIIATIALFYGVQHWNSWMDNLLYVTKKDLYVLQYVLQNILMNGQTPETEIAGDIVIHTETMKMATLILSLIPIVSTYPFLQRYFVKGVTVGSVKG